MSVNDLNPWFEMVPQSTVGKLLDPIADPLGKGIGGVASFIMNPFMKLGIINKYNMENFEKKIMEKNSSIPPENRDTSKQGLALKAVEDSIYQLDSEDLQDMFSNLIAASLDNRKNADLHPSFSTILKDFSPKDAILFKEFYRLTAIPSVTIRFQSSEKKSGINILENILLIDGRTIIEPVALNNLNRFGLVEIVSGIYLSSTQNSLRYQQFEESPRDLNEKAKLPVNSGEFSLDDIAVNKGKVEITSLGKLFGKTVIS